MTLTRPAALKPGALLGIVSPASIVKPELVEQGIAALHALGYRTRLMPHALDRGPLNYAGTVEHRLADLHAAFADPKSMPFSAPAAAGAPPSSCRISTRN